MSKSTFGNSDLHPTQLTAPWRSLIDQFIAAQAELGRSENMQGQHRHRLGLFAEYVAGDPSAVTRPQVLRWLDAAECSDLERKKRAQSLRIFFTWARRAGYVSGNPTTRLVLRAPSGPARRELPESWAAAFDDWSKFMRAAGRPDSTIELRRLHLTRIAHELGLDPWEVSRDDLVDWLSAKDWRSETRRSHRTTIRSFYRWATTFDRIAEDPALNLPAIAVMPGVPRPAADVDIRIALAGADSHTRLMILLATKMGLRRGEIAKVHTDDVTENALIVRGKGGRTRLLPFADDVRAALAGVPTGYVFPSPRYPGRPLTAGAVGKMMSRQLGDGVTAHMLRHRFATVAYAAERDILAVQTLLGHSRLETTLIYAQVAQSSLTTAVAAAAQL